MKDITELPGGTEQGKNTQSQPRPRTAPRSRPDNTTPSGQEHENKAPARRRPPSNTANQNFSSAGTSSVPQNSNTSAPNRPAGNTHRSPNTNNPSGPRPSSGGPRSNGGPGGGRGGSSGGYSGHSGHSGPAGGPGTGHNGPTGGPGGGYNGPTNRSNNQRSGGPNRSPYGGGNSQAPQRPERQGPGGGGHGPSQRAPQRGNVSQGSRPSGGARPANRSSNNAPRSTERRAPQVKEKVTGPVSLPPQMVVKDLAEELHTTAIEVIRTLIKHGVFANINQVVDYEQAALIAKELGFEPSPATATSNASTQTSSPANDSNKLVEEGPTVEIPPVVTIMGHVDHGKTSLLDTIRETKVAAGEAGGITQHIGAYQVEVNGKKITFMDTPGHEAFTAMRARGAQSTNIVIIVVAADDGVMPQTKEAIDHAKAAGVPIIIALNKIDKLNANPDRVKQQLAEIDVVIEEYGGTVVCVPVSARKNIGIDELLEYILLVAEVQDIRANPNRLATGVIIEAKLEKNSGVTANVLVQQGTLKMGDNFIVGGIAGKVRAMFNDRGKRIQKAPPSTPVSILGLPEVPQAGDRLEVVAEEKIAKQRAQQEAEKRRAESTPLGQVSLDTLYTQMQEGKVKELNVVLKTDVQGSSEAIKNALSKLGEENLKVRLIHEGVGNISETDVHLASASGAIIIAFNVKVDGAALREAQKEGVDIRHYAVIYKLIDDIQAALHGMLEPTFKEVIDGHAEVLQTFKAGKNVVIAGCRITDGKIVRSAQARILRKNEKVYDGKIASLRRGKDDVREVQTGYECGIILEDFLTFEVGDIIEVYSQERVLPGA